MKKSWIKSMFYDFDNGMLDSIILQWYNRAKTITMYPESFLRLCQRFMQQPDRIYKLATLLFFIHADPGIKIGLQAHEKPDTLKYFLSMLGSRIAFYMTGTRYNGKPYKPGDNRAERHVGCFVMLMGQIASLL